MFKDDLMQCKDGVSKMLKSSELAEQLGLAKNTVINLANAGKIPSYKIPSGAYRFDLNEVKAALRVNGGADDV